MAQLFKSKTTAEVIDLSCLTEAGLNSKCFRWMLILV